MFRCVVLPNMAEFKGELVSKAKVRVYKSKTFKRWFKSLTASEKRIIDSRIDTFKKDEVLIKVKNLSKKLSLFEFKWDSGVRVYFSLLKDKDGNFMLLLTGGNKNSQKSDIAESKRIIVKAVLGIQEKEKTE